MGSGEKKLGWPTTDQFPQFPPTELGFSMYPLVTMACWMIFPAMAKKFANATHVTINNSEWIKTTVTTFKYYWLCNIAVCAHCFTCSEPSNIRTGILDYLREGFPWPARPFKHTESNSFKHTESNSFKHTVTVTTFKIIELYLNIRTGISNYLRGLAVWPALHIFKCRYRKKL